MAAHNQVRVLGYLLSDPAIYKDETGDAKIYLAIRACNRAVDGYPDSSFQDLLIFYDGASEDHNRDKLMTRLKSLVAYDLVDIKGVINVLSVNKPSICPSCGEKNVKVFGVSCFIYPITVIKLDGLQASADYDEKIPERILQEHYLEVSNDVDVVGTVVSDPEIVAGLKYPCCRYRLAVDRKYYIKTQDSIYVDHPWVYSYGKQGKNDMKYLQPGAVVFVSGFLRNRNVLNNITCQNCDTEYQFEDIATEIIPYSVEYMRNYKWDDEIDEKNLYCQ